jgi:hypothetical protein
VRTVNAIMLATCWKVVRRIVEFEQIGEKRMGYGEELLDRLATDINSRFDHGFSRRTLQPMRRFYDFAPAEQIWQTLTAKLAIRQLPQRLVMSLAVTSPALLEFHLPPSLCPKVEISMTVSHCDSSRHPPDDSGTNQGDRAAYTHHDRIAAPICTSCVELSPGNLYP